MNYKNGDEMNRQDWEFEYVGSVLAEASKTKKIYRESRLAWWKTKEEELMKEVKESGLEINESVGSSYMSNAGRAPHISVRGDLQDKLSECHSKIKEHSEAAREYDGWIQVLTSNPESILKLKHSDWLFFFSKES